MLCNSCILKDEEHIRYVNYMKENANKRESIKKEVEGHVNEFRKSVEEIMEVKKKIEDIEIHKLNEDYINSQIAYTSISNNLNFTMDANSYSKTKELKHVLESKKREGVGRSERGEGDEGPGSYENSLIYFRFVHLASLLYTNDVETIAKVRYPLLRY
ncbi:hypothetical protein POVCU1_054530 [Plasmodium ovale curtisi]|uniref:Uncharacterized protein n=1 Tax=Plasmodium ovale curtisi TaxID=864141 RepID=A0A1A8X662_PLAOA|nr:hypothetical protein POVCU1_054530 [Plasmodium ovale curtisi]